MEYQHRRQSAADFAAQAHDLALLNGSRSYRGEEHKDVTDAPLDQCPTRYAVGLEGRPSGRDTAYTNSLRIGS